MVEETIEIERTTTEEKSVLLCDGCGGEFDGSQLFLPVDTSTYDDMEPTNGRLRLDEKHVGSPVHLCSDCLRDGSGPGLRDVDTTALLVYEHWVGAVLVIGGTGVIVGWFIAAFMLVF
ncbi:hypothetical protein [Halomicrobium sp. LC1Hm]|uniref:hypothetical protein n=1 Tax=Halomicrobium sp. LC1Hm TaxID=2610902 RepID=UPI001298538F|nr:hypothetical protein [Halomicrobium sp. LC1Hm]QGA82759.1 hypothetical protein LC1Hm_1715 [Halomicrobium sp. LC1Hm]